MVKQRTTVWILIAILSITYVYAQGVPFQEGTTDTFDFIRIVYPSQLKIPRNSITTFNFDVLNASYHKLTTPLASCSFAVENHTGQVLKNGFLTYVPALKFWQYNLTATDTKELGNYNFYVYCNNTENEAGYIDFFYEVKETGDNVFNNQVMLYVLLGIMFVIAVLVYMANNWNFSIFMRK